MPRFACSARLLYGLAAFGVVGFGLLWRSRMLSLPSFLAKYGGDALWAAMVYLLIRLARPNLATVQSAALAFAIAALVEFTQLYHAPWIDSVRITRLGALALGNTFNWPDILAYAFGVTIAAFLDAWLRTDRHASPIALRPRIHP